ncbi:MAG: hypothetical protein QM691_12665 [Opitutaceae bacterium]
MSGEPPSSLVAGLGFVGRDGGAVKSLAGFQKSRHTLPTAVNAATSAFLAKLCAGELTEQAELFFQRTREALAYKRRELSLAVASPVAVLTAADFTFELAYALDPAEPAQYTVTRTLRDLRRPELVRQPAFDTVFAGLFTELTFALGRGVRVEAVIDVVEALPAAAGLAVAYPSDCHDCTLTVAGVAAEVRCTGATLDLVFAAAGSPAELLDGFAAVRAAFALSPELAALLA